MNLVCSCFPQRYVMVFMSFLAVTLFYCERTSLRITFTEIALHFNLTDGKTLPSYYQHDSCTVELYNWGEKKQSEILVTFYYGYLLFRAPGVILIKKFGCKYILLLATFLFSVLAILLPFAACNSAATLTAVRALMGIAMSVFFPALTGLIAQWSPQNERTLLMATALGGCQVGVVITWMLPGFLLEMITWQHMYAILGSIGIVWCCIWSILCYEYPSNHPFISPEELDYLKKCAPEMDKSMPTPWMSILKSGPVWASTLANTGFVYGFHTIVFNLPKYYLDISHVSHTQNDALIVLPFLLMYLASILLGFLTDKIIFLKWTTITQVRRIVAILGAIGPGIGVVSAAYLPDKASQVALITTVMASMSMGFCSVGVNAIDLSPNHAYVVMALSNGVAGLSGILVPAVVSTIMNSTNDTTCSDNKKRQWQNIFWIMFAVLVITHLPFLMFGSGEVQPWDKPNLEENHPNRQRRNSTKSREYLSRNKSKSHTQL